MTAGLSFSEAVPRTATLAPVANDGSPLSPAVLDEHHFRLLVDWLERGTGVCIHAHRQPGLRRMLAERLRELGQDGETYCARVVRYGTASTEHQWLLDRLLIHETAFFRHQESHDFVRRQVQEYRRSGVDSGLNLWSLGCATGEEAYSLALDALAGGARRFAVIGTDISRAVLSHARQGVYPLAAMAVAGHGLPADWIEPAGSGYFRFAAQVREHVAFVADNALAQRTGIFPEGVDIIFCQNLLIYQRRWRRHALLDFLASRLKPGGYLIIGPGEGADWQSAALQKVRSRLVCAYWRPRNPGVPRA